MSDERKLGHQMRLLGAIYAAMHFDHVTRFAQTMDEYREQWVDASVDAFAEKLKETSTEDFWRELTGGEK